MGQMKTPGVYIVEKNAFPNSVVEVATAVPAFIGYTEKAENNKKSLEKQPWRISSMAEYEKSFGGPPKPQFSFATIATNDTPSAFLSVLSIDGTKYKLTWEGQKYLLYYSMRLFFQNGGGPCYIVSVGQYGENIEKSTLLEGLPPLEKEQEPTMVVIPEAIRLSEADCATVQQQCLMHCGQKMKNRVAIVDVWDGYKQKKECIPNFRNGIGSDNLDFASVYYPWVNTTIVSNTELTFNNLDQTGQTSLKTVLQEELKNVLDALPDVEKLGAATTGGATETTAATGGATETTETPEKQEERIDKMLRQISPTYMHILKLMTEQLNLFPPAAAMAGVYTKVDDSRGVWKAPANVSLNSVISPAVNITNEEQEDLNVTTTGKSVNAIRPFIGEGTMVWGARTLDGNSLDWRYVNVRRTMIMLEESIRLAAKSFVFENNVATTWITLKSMINNFLNGIWKRGGLAGSTPEDAFSVSVGLGETMTADDILEGILKVTVLVALIRPAEFIEITFQQQMQKS